VSLIDTREMRWQLKQLLRFSPALTKKNTLGNPDTVLKRFDTAQLQRYQQLQQSYSLDDWPRLCDKVEYIENLYVLDVLTQHLPTPLSGGRGLDIGCRNFSHLPALSAFMHATWDGVELDAYARYLNGYTRRAYGEWMAKQREQARYIAGSLLDVNGRYDLIVWILPFIVPAPLRAWGLPSRFFQPLQLLQHAYALLNPGGFMLIVNQGDAEAEVQQQLLDAAAITARPLGELRSPFSPFRNKRMGWLVQRS
jgi:SAM-dependent methyltransferase